MTIQYFIKKHLKKILKNWGLIPASKLAYKYLKGLKGIEIGAGSQCNFCLNTINVDIADLSKFDNPYSQAQKKVTGKVTKVDVIASGDNLPFDDNSYDFVINSHVLEHFYDPIKAIQEWVRVVKPNGYVFMIIPHKERTFDKDRERTTLNELIERHQWTLQNPDVNKGDAHHSVWITEDVLELCKYLNLNVVEYHDKDDNVGNGFTIIIKK